MLYDGCFKQHFLPRRRLYMQIECHLMLLCCCCCSLINNLILQALWMWQCFCHIVMCFLCCPPWDLSSWMWLWWHAIILPVKRIRMPDLPECQWAPSPWKHRRLKWHNGLVERNALCACIRMCVCFYDRASSPWRMHVVRMCLYSCVGVNLWVHLHRLNQINPYKSNVVATIYIYIFIYIFIYNWV